MRVRNRARGEGEDWVSVTRGLREWRAHKGKWREVSVAEEELQKEWQRLESTRHVASRESRCSGRV